MVGLRTKMRGILIKKYYLKIKMECGTRVGALPKHDLVAYLMVVVKLNEHINVIKIN